MKPSSSSNSESPERRLLKKVQRKLQERCNRWARLKDTARSNEAAECRAVIDALLAQPEGQNAAGQPKQPGASEADRPAGISVESRSVDVAVPAAPVHTDHPLRHWDRTCPACVAESAAVDARLKAAPDPLEESPGEMRLHPVDGKPWRCMHGSTLCSWCNYLRLQEHLRRSGDPQS